MRRRHYFRTTFVSIATGLLATAHAQWAVTDLHPQGADASSANLAAGGYAYGAVESGASWQAERFGQGPAVNFNPLGATASGIAGVDGSYQYGSATFDQVHAGRWNGSAATFEDWNPQGADWSIIYAAESGVAGGYAAYGGTEKAILWNGGGPNDITSLHNDNWLNSSVDAIDGGVQYGDANLSAGVYHAMKWTGSAASYEDMNPIGSQASQVIDSTAGTQVGFADFGTGNTAVVWHGSALSAAAVGPSGFDASVAFGTTGQYVAGIVWKNGVSHAGFWDLSTNLFTDLQPFLSGYQSSSAYDVQVYGGQIQVFGVANPNTGDGGHAVMWTMPVPEPGCMLGQACLLLPLARRRKAR